MLMAVGLAATMAIPAVSASATVSPRQASARVVADFIQKAQQSKAQQLRVSAAVAEVPITRDKSSVFYAAAVQKAEGVSAGGASPATPLSVGAHMYINPPDLGGGGAAVVQYALQFVGMVPYIVGGNSPSTGFSCDTFVRYVYEQFGVYLPGDAVVEASKGTVIPESEAVMGDLVYYSHQHIGFYDGHGGIIDAPKPGTDISHRAIWGHPVFIRL
jgi:cell wall-associated NlpC family hydrolase